MAATLKKHKEWDRPKSCLTALPKQLSVLSQFEQIKEKDIVVLVEQLVTSRLGPIPEADPVNDDQGSEEYHHALANLITDINLTDQSSLSENDPVSNGSIEQNGRKVKVAFLLKLTTTQRATLKG